MNAYKIEVQEEDIINNGVSFSSDGNNTITRPEIHKLIQEKAFRLGIVDKIEKRDIYSKVIFIINRVIFHDVYYQSGHDDRELFKKINWQDFLELPEPQSGLYFQYAGRAKRNKIIAVSTPRQEDNPLFDLIRKRADFYKKERSWIKSGKDSFYNESLGIEIRGTTPKQKEKTMKIFKVTLALPKIINGELVGLREVEYDWKYADNDKMALTMVNLTEYAEKHNVEIGGILHNAHEVGFTKVVS